MRRLLTGSALAVLVSYAPRSLAQNAAGSVAPPSPLSAKAMVLHDDMRRLWTDHVVWTRGYIVAATSNDPSASVALSRLMKNQEDIGNAVRPFYGDAAASQLTTLLKQHIGIAGELVTAAMAGNTAKQTDADQRWHDNAVAIAVFLSGANPNWPKQTLVDMLNNHLQLTAREATARIKKNWTDDQMAFDQIVSQAMEMADALSAGIIAQFPTKV
jgi:hypothetical protein